MYDCIIVGGGPAGLNAALVLGRARRRVLVCDSGKPRNYAAQQVNGFFSRDGTPPQELLRTGREEIARYGVEFLRVKVCHAQCLPCDEPLGPRTSFEVFLEGGRRLVTRKLLLATGVRDALPEIPGLDEYYGKSIHHCPYCDGWEHRDQRLAALGSGRAAVGLALLLRTWSEQVVACTQGVVLDAPECGRLDRNGIGLREERVVGFEGTNGQLRRLLFDHGEPLACDALFFNTEQAQQSHLPSLLGCTVTAKGQITTQHRQWTGIPGLYLAGDADGEVQFVVVAAAEGATAAVAISREIQDEDRGERR